MMDRNAGRLSRGKRQQAVLSTGNGDYNTPYNGGRITYIVLRHCAALFRLTVWRLQESSLCGLAVNQNDSVS